MPAIRIAGVQGLIPKLAPRLLPDNAALVANNVKLQSGEWRPYRAPGLRTTPAKPMPPLTLYRAVNGASADWFSWPFDVDVVKVPLSADVEARFCWTGDGEPRWAPYSLAVSGATSAYPKQFYTLGIPAPQAPPTVATSGGIGSTVTRSYCYTFFSQHGEESAPSPASAATSGKVDGTWTVSGMDAFPANSGVGTAAYAGGYTTFTNTGNHWLRAGDEITLGSASVAVSSVVSATVFQVPGDFSTQTSWTRVAPWNTTGMKRRLYRTEGTDAAFQLVHDDVGTSYADTLSATQILGDELISQGWEPPPPGLRGLVVTSFGSLAGFVGNVLCLSEPYQPHAWKQDYRYGADFPIVALAAAGADIVAATSANPYVATGADPGAMSFLKIDGAYPCLSKRSMVSDGAGAVFASKYGLVYVVGGAARVLTEPWFGVDEWQDYAPQTMVCEVAYGRLYCAYVDASGNRRMLLIDPQALPVTLTVAAWELYTDDTTGTLYLGTREGICEFDAPEAPPLVMEVRSKTYVLSAPANFGAAKVGFEQAIAPSVAAAIETQRQAALAINAGKLASGLVKGAFNAKTYNARAFNGSDMVDVPAVPAANSVTFTLYRGEVPCFSRVVSSDKAFRLPAGVKFDEVSVQINSQCNVKYVALAETMEGLKQV